MFPGWDPAGPHFGVVLVKGVEAGAATFPGDPRQDVLRRDFTIKALPMDPVRAR